MTRRRLALVALLLLAASLPVRSAPGSPPAVRWQPWSDAAFVRARQEKRFVLLDLEAVWCHWCHVMDATTYRDPAVRKLIAARYVAVRVDQDSRPDLSNRYEDYGWPATVVFDGSGQEVVKLAGYLPPARMAALLQAIIRDPSPGPSVTQAPATVPNRESSLTEAERRRLEALNVERYDTRLGGWGSLQKYLDPDSVEYAMEQAGRGDAKAEKRARQTIRRTLEKLVDPVWGGVYQYSAEGDWAHPHFEKIMSFQADDMRIFALAFARWKDPAYRSGARAIQRFLARFLTAPSGAFYTSQDADLIPGRHSADYFRLDDAERCRRGIPRVDRHVYARENGWAIHALATLYAATRDRAALASARRAAAWIAAHRSLLGGGFRHGEKDAAGPYLGDTVSMGRAFLSLYAVTGERPWLERARQAADFIAAHFRGKVGWVTTCVSEGSAACRPQRDENVMLARFANLLRHYTGHPAYGRMAEHAMRYLAAPQVAERFNTAGVLLADAELHSDPVHVTVVGSHDDPAARGLFAVALQYPSAYRVTEWWDPRAGPLPGASVSYPRLSRAAAFLCTGGSCSSPKFDAARLEEVMRRLSH